MNVTLGTKSKETNFFGDEKFRVVNVDDRDIYFNGVINADSMLDLVRELKHCERKRIKALKVVKREMKAAKDKLKEEDLQHISFSSIEPQPIILHINSGGGSVFDVLFAIDEIKTQASVGLFPENKPGFSNPLTLDFFNQNQFDSRMKVKNTLVI
jgi:ATP-dependent protease ClpP protease subunit